MVVFCEELLLLLVCPLSKVPLVYDKANQRLINERDRLYYPIVDGIPILLPQEAKALDEGSLVPCLPILNLPGK